MGQDCLTGDTPEVAVARIGRTMEGRVTTEWLSTFVTQVAGRMPPYDIRGVVLVSDGPDFCTGGPSTSCFDLGSELREIAPPTQRLPLAASVHGSAFGGGLALVLACDAVVAAPWATFSTSFVPGVATGDEMGLVHLLHQRLGDQRATELFLTARLISAAEALELGIITVIRTTEDHFSTAVELLTKSPRPDA